jgi:beta-galactosidase
LVQTERLYIPFPWESLRAGVVITTPTVKKDCATIDVKTTVRNEHAEPRACTLLTRVIDAEGCVVLRMRKSAEISAGGEYTFSQVDGIDEDLHLWSCDEPYLYRVHCQVFDGDEAVDGIENRLGIREFELREDGGFLLNGEELMLIGTNRHQQYPYIGDAVPKSLHRKDALQFKQAGFNVVRLAHYPHDNAFVEACDELGILVYEEGPTWIDFGSEKWNENLEEALRRAVRNHRNHPSIFAWGGGINHRGPFEPLHYAAKEEDPTRLTASNHSAWSGSQRSDVCDFYSNMDYGNMDGELEEPLFAMEHGSSVDGERTQVIVSRYKGDPLRFGMAAWTAHAYYTFHPQTGGQLNRTRGGMMDIFRIPRPVFYWYQSELTVEPMIYIADAWREGMEQLRVFSNCDEVELLINGASTGRRRPDADPQKGNLNSPPFTFRVCWQEGEVTARGWKDGQVVATETARTPETPVRLELSVDMEGRELVADGADIVLAFAHVVDGHGTTVTDYAGRVAFEVEGPAEIVGGAEIESNPMECFDGIAPVLVRAGLGAGEIVLRGEAEGLEGGEVRFASVPYSEDALIAVAQPIYDLPRMKVDLGGERQHIQYGWAPWVGEDGPEASFDLSGLGRVVLRGASGENLRWRGESNVPGPLGFMAEDGVCSPSELNLEFIDLEAGRYVLKTYHHGPESDTNNMDPLAGKEHEADIAKMPPAVCLDIAVEDADGEMRSANRFVPQGKGKRIDGEGPACSPIEFCADGRNPVRVRIVSTDGDGSVWLNGIDLEESPGRASAARG